MKIITHNPGYELLATFDQALGDNVHILIEENMSVYFFVGDCFNTVPFNIAFIPYINQMMEIFYNAQH